MKKYIALVSCLIALFVDAQINVEQSDLPQIGTSIGLLNYNATEMSPGQANSEAQDWDYSMIENITNDFTIVDFIDPAVTVWPKEFSSAELAREGSLFDLLDISFGGVLPIDIGLFDAVAYYVYNSNGDVEFIGAYVEEGIPGFLDGPLIFESNEPFVMYQTGSYGTTINSEASLGLELDLSALGIDGIDQALLEITNNKNAVADAFGTMTLPNSEHEVLRYDNENEIGLSLYPMIFGFPIPIALFDTSFVTTNYSFYAKELEFPLANMGYTETDTSFLITSFQAIEELPELIANFDFTVDNDSCGLVSFINESIGNDAIYAWDFGDGTGISEEENPVYTFAEEGTYNVVMTATTESGGIFTVDQEVEISCEEPVELFASYTYEESMEECGEVNFTNTTIGVGESYVWDFGTGDTSFDENPIYTFTENGTYEVILTAFASNDATSSNSLIVEIDCHETDTTGVDIQQLDMSDFVIAPQPVTSHFQIMGFENVVINSVIILSIEGKQLLEIKGNNRMIAIDNYPEGMYFCIVNERYLQKFVIGK